MQLENYLLKLDEKSYIKKGSDSIRLYNLGPIIESIYKDLKKFKPIADIEKASKTHQTYSNWILNKTGISIQEFYSLCNYWKLTCHKTDKQLFVLWNKIYKNSYYFGCTNGKQIRLPKVLDSNLAYLLGVIMGDGHLANPDRSYDKLTTYNSEIRITSGDRSTFVNLSKIFEALFHYKPRIYSELSKVNRKFYRFVIKSKPIHRFLMNICGVPIGKKCYKIDVLPLIKNAPLKLQKKFIVGFIDADGCIRLAKQRYPMVSVSQLDPRILEYIINFSKLLGIKWNGPYKSHHPNNRNSMIYLSDKVNFKKYLKHFSPIDPTRKEQVKFVLSHMYGRAP